MDFGQALHLLRAGRKLARRGWNGEGMWMVLQKGYPDGIAINENTATAIGAPAGAIYKFEPYLMLKTVEGTFVPMALSNADVLADDWAIVD